MKYGKEISVGVTTVAAVAASATMVSAQDWSGLYVGAGVGYNGGHLPVDDGYDYELTGVATSAFVGYNKEISDGKFVIGAELAVNPNRVEAPHYDSSYPDDYQMNWSADIKAKVGVKINNVLAYGLVGYSMAGVEYGDGGEYDYTHSGLNYGAGVAMMVSDNMSIGVEHVVRGFDMYGDDWSVPASHTQLRVAFSF